MPRRRRGAVDSSESEEEPEAAVNTKVEESDAYSDASEPNGASGPDDASEPSDDPEPIRARNRRRRLRLRQAGSTNENGEDSPHFPVVLRTNGRRRPKVEEDESYSDASASAASDSDTADEEEELEFSDGGFVVDSDDNVIPKKKTARRSRGPPRKKQRRRPKVEQFSGSDDDDEFSGSDDSITEELRELKGEQSPPQKLRHYRERPPVDYAIPPPPTVEEIAQSTAKPPAKDVRPRRLFDVKGPFGGQEVHTIFELPATELKEIVARGEARRGAIDKAAAAPATAQVPQAANDRDSADVDPVDVSGDVDFSMVGGLDDYVSKLKEMVSLPLLYPELYEKFGLTPPRGVLFHGPPGTGKTLMARALAASHRQEKVTFYMRKGADVLSKWIGESERQLRALFEEAQKNQPSIIFFDEIDGLAPVRSARQEQHHASIVSTLLALMDGMDNRGQVVIIGATNRPDSVDPALRRPGRFDREFYFPLPDLDARKRILEIHTSKWVPKLSDEFVADVAQHTKGFGGADLRAVATEAALLAIQRAYPQIYGSDEKLRVDPNSIKVRPQDFTLALEKIQPSTARQAGTSLAQPLPPRVQPLLQSTWHKICERVAAIFPRESKSAAQAALFLDDQQFKQAQTIKHFQQARVFRPRLLLSGRPGNGQIYLGRALAHMLEGVYVRELSTNTIFTNAIAPESAIVSAITEARQRSPACILLPQLNEWLGVPHLDSLLAGLLKSLLPSEQVFVVGTCQDSLAKSPLTSFFDTETLRIELDREPEVLHEYFAPIFEFVVRTPTQCLQASEMPISRAPPLPKAPSTAPPVGQPQHQKPVEEQHTGVFSQSERAELRVRSQLKLKLGIILDGFRQRYRRFRKPVIDETRLAYLFEMPPATDNVDAEKNEDEDEEPFQRTSDNMILEVATSKKYFNMDLETIEDRLWNGFYCEPIQFLEDIEMIYRDSVTLGERERMHKASEMVANAQVAIDDISLDKPFIHACEELHAKDAQVRLNELEEKAKASNTEVADENDLPEASQEINGDAMHTDADPPAAPAQGSAVSETQVTEALSTNPTAEMVEEVASEVVAQATPQNPPHIEPDRRVVCNEDMFSAFKDTLIAVASSQTLDGLEQLFATLTDVAWQYRTDWDRSSMLAALAAHIKSI